MNTKHIKYQEDHKVQVITSQMKQTGLPNSNSYSNNIEIAF